MVESVIDICNGGLDLLAADPINSFDDGLNGARCKRQWSKALDAVLRMHPWNCAVKRIQIAPDSTAPLFEYSTAFTLPADVIRLLEVKDNTDYKIEGRKILTNASSLSIKYVYRNVNVVEYDALLVQALEHYMAWKLAHHFDKSGKTKKIMWDGFLSIFPLAKNIDAQEEPQGTFGGTSSLKSVRY